MRFMLTIIIAVMLVFIPTAGQSAVVVHEQNAHSGNRHNALRAAELLHNHVIKPGQVFSFNDAVGSRTAEKGFIPGHAIVGPQHILVVGGGVCRASTAVYQAAREAGLPIVERHPHSRPVGYTPPGTDATIWWPSADLKFRNNTGHPLIIRSGGDLRQIQIVICPFVEIHHAGRPAGLGWLQEGRTMVYLRAVAETLGATVEWKEGRAHINGCAVPENISRFDHGTLAVPLRDLVEMMGLTAGWETGHVTVEAPPGRVF